MNEYVIDAYAWLEYLDGSERGEKVRKLIFDRSSEVYTNIVTLSELISVAKRKGMDAEKAFEIIISISRIYQGNIEFHKEVGLLHAELRKKIKDIGLSDIFVLLTARKFNAKIITGDPHFKNQNAIMI